MKNKLPGSNKPIIYDAKALEQFERSQATEPFFRQALGMARTYEEFLQFHRDPVYTAAIEYQFRNSFFKPSTIPVVYSLQSAGDSLKQMVSLALSSTRQFPGPVYGKELNKYVYHISCALWDGPERVEENLARMVSMKDRKKDIIRMIATDPDKVRHLYPVILDMQRYDRHFRECVKEAVHAAVAQCYLMKSQLAERSWVRTVADQKPAENIGLGGYLM